MKKLFVIFVVLYSIDAFAYYTQNIPDSCGVFFDNKMYAVFTPNQYTCSVGQFLPANTLGCTSCPKGFVCDGGTFDFDTTKDQGATPDSFICNSGYFLPANDDTCRACPTGLSCSGGTFVFNTNENQGLVYPTTVTNNLTNTCAKNAPKIMSAIFTPNTHTCSAGYYLPANVDACTLCPANNICSGGTYTFNETTDQGIIACAAPTPYAPTGSSQCYPHILHVDDGVVYLRSTKLTSPSLHIRIEDDVFYANMTTIPTRMNKDSVRYFHSQWDDNHYYICDDTTYPGE